MNAAEVAYWGYIITFALIVLVKIVCFILGYLTILLGYKLIKAGVSGEFKFSAKYKGFQSDLVSVSPGLLFLMLGVILIGFAMFTKKGASMDYSQKFPHEIFEKPALDFDIEDSLDPDQQLSSIDSTSIPDSVITIPKSQEK